jgi:uncharacterized protein YecE (DUF72 family)
MRSGSELKVGCCGFAGSQADYFQVFKLIEIQSTFYQLPELKTAGRWRRSAPASFEFTLKAWQLITHTSNSPTYRHLRDKIGSAMLDHYGSFQPTYEVFEAWERTARFACTLGAKVVLFQCPASFTPVDIHITNMRGFFSHIDRQGLSLAWEPRGAWPYELIGQICEDLKLIHCVDPFKNHPWPGKFLYFRLHGIDRYGYRYSDADLTRLLAWVKDRPGYVLFNNVWMKEDAQRFIQMAEI